MRHPALQRVDELPEVTDHSLTAGRDVLTCFPSHTRSFPDIRLPPDRRSHDTGSGSSSTHTAR